MNDIKERTAAILEGDDASVAELKRLAEELKKMLDFGDARKLLAKAREKAPDDIEIAHQLALCTYKDEELLPNRRFADALEILEGLNLRDPVKADPETLRLGGAIYKRKWEQGGQLENLYEALAFYRAAYEKNPEEDKGYGGCNAAYILDILSARARAVARRTQTESAEAKALEAQARQLREQMAAQFSQLSQQNPKLNHQYWFVVTAAEIHYGLGHYEEAGNWLARTPQLEPTEWEKQTTFRQLVSIARLQGVEPPREKTDPDDWHWAWRALSRLLEEDTEPALACYRGKLGLALSGGGFRASLFHLGVLARLAEMDVLRGVEVLSTVSGGSIVGAHYYLEMQKLLQTKADKDITREDYIEMVRRVQQEFLAGVQRNLRMRSLADFGKNLRMIFLRSYTLSHRLGELYEQELYSRVADGHPAGEPRRMRDLLIHPQGEAEGFKPKFSNWRRRAKVPVLLLNATSLNTGHTWHFTASWMGEPPGLLGDEVDKNERYRRMYYHQTPAFRPELQNYPLGYAVAASACVPGLFDPLVIEMLYPDRVVRLVDGGVHDNQGVAGLLNEGCNLLLCSDATGQMEDRPKPSGGPVGVLTRSSSILMARVRGAGYRDLQGRVDSRSLEGLFFVHLKKDLPIPPVDWIDCQDPTPAPSTPQTTTSYGVDCKVQKLLSLVRTDLDAFSEVEAYALMLSGYLMTEHEFQQLQKGHEKNGEPGTWGGFAVDAQREDWPFLQLEPLVKAPGKDPQGYQELCQQLTAASSSFFKAWQLDRSLRWGGIVGIIAVVLLVLWLVWTYKSTTIFTSSITVGGLFLFIVATVAGFIMPVVKWFSPERASWGILRKAALGLVGYVVSQLHLRVFDGLFLRRGRLKRLLRSQQGKGG